MLKLKIDPWSSDYGPSLHFSADEEESPLDLNLEGDWVARDAVPTAPPQRVALVDGVRRMELNLRLEDEHRSLAAAIGTVGSGAILLKSGQPQSLSQALRCVSVEALLLMEGHEGPELPSLVRHFDCPDPMLALQNRMRSLESEVASRVAPEADMVLADGPLQCTYDLKSEVVGYIKSQHRQLLPQDRFELVRRLLPGQRSPIFRLGSSRFDRLSWYLRLDHPAAGETTLAGIVRLEMQATYGLERARARAEQLSHLLLRLGNRRHRDPRSPQNLIPIAVLEQALRHRLGDPTLRQRNYRKILSGAPS